MQPLLRSQKNDIFKTLVSAGIDEAIIGQFEWEHAAQKYRAFSSTSDDGSGIALVLKHGGYTFFFYFIGSGNYWVFHGFPMGFGNDSERVSGLKWSALLEKLKDWAKKISVEINIPDLWSELSNIKSGYSFDYGEFQNNDPITAKEAQAIRHKLETLERRIIDDYGNTDTNKKVIREKFEYLDECIERHGKRDWIYTLIGALASLAIQLGVSAANSDRFWQLVKDVLGSPIKLLLGN